MASQPHPDVEPLRRFSLLAGLVLIGYVAAGVELPSGAQISVLGIPFIIRRPEFLPLALLLASAYGLGRYFYYAVMLTQSPRTIRKDLLQQLQPYSGFGTDRVSAFFGPSKYSTTPSTRSRAEVETKMVEVIGAFPKVWNIRPTGKIERYQVSDDDGEPYAECGHLM